MFPPADTGANLAIVTDVEVLAVLGVGLLSASLFVTRRSTAHLSERLMAVQREADSERARLSRELHDGVGQRLIGLKLQLQLSRLPGATSAASHAETLVMLDGVIEEVRAMSHAVRPAPFDDGLLIPALTAMARSEAGRAGLCVLVDAPDEDLRICHAAESACYHAAREALANVIKHARARNLAVSIKPDGGLLTVHIADDGDGFDAHGVSRRAASRGRLGLVGMREGLKRVGGALEINSQPGIGTTVVCRVPLEGTLP